MPPFTQPEALAVLQQIRHEWLQERQLLYSMYNEGLLDQEDVATNLAAMGPFEAYEHRKWCEAVASHKASRKQLTVGGQFLLTFTMDPSKSEDRAAFHDAVTKQLKRMVVLRGSYAFEHLETNYHCHALVKSQYNLTACHFKPHATKWGHVDVRRVGVDNGIAAYLGKESEITVFENKNLE